jgi:hypothetical protein
VGSFDRKPEDWDQYADTSWEPRHVIFCDSKWSARPDRHEHDSALDVRVCFEAARDEKAGIPVWECGWLMLGRYDDGSEYSYPCEAPARFTDKRGSHECAAGHSHVPAEVRFEQGWDYADEDEAAGLMRNGVLPVRMDGTRF